MLEAGLEAGHAECLMEAGIYPPQSLISEPLVNHWFMWLSI